ncbi:hypothetical protein NDK43_11005 [Neobacillus pocheonensis]|uniref:Uncharacterized protein n=1 Tax=Neobacillus pocheonensis TaxID=363869 RepID=A0ABT0WCR1_9BACI|nr:hypothetical protein [Neobacillus pocheonensis]
MDLKTVGGSGWSTNTTVLSYDPQTKSLKKNLDLTNYNSTTELKNNQLLVHTPDGDTEFSWNGEQFEGKQVFLQPSVGLKDKVIHYAISNQEAIVNSQSVNLKIGQRLVLIRDDQNKISQRTMFDAIGVIDSDDKGNGFIAKAVGTTKITIIPNEYDWDKSKVINVTVIQ